MQWLFAIRPVSQVLTVESILGKLRPPEIELSVLNQSGLAAKEFMDGGGTGVEFALDSPFIELQAAEPHRDADSNSLRLQATRRGELRAAYGSGRRSWLSLLLQSREPRLPIRRRR